MILDKKLKEVSQDDFNKMNDVDKVLHLRKLKSVFQPGYHSEGLLTQ